ncbi:MAG: hypothetical protein ACP6IS_10820 [Candidatus Asgardarchaeia archaeon]
MYVSMDKISQNKTRSALDSKIDGEEIEGELILKLFKNALNKRAMKIFLRAAYILNMKKSRLNFNRLLIIMRKDLKMPESTLKWNIKKLKQSGLLDYELGQPIELTLLGRLIYYLLINEIEKNYPR